VTFKTIGQTNIKTNDSLVCISKDVAIKITKDLVKKDYLEQKTLLLEKDTALLSQLVATYIKNSVIATNKEIAYKAVIVDYKRSLANSDLYASQLYKDVRRAKTKTTISQIALIALTIFTIIKL
tara:strand:+ start:817 stop:1188 length:372 start_codon:yes stop_codon:yes gene_type:complete